MFSLHERTQRKVCRTVFVALCAVPTLFTLCWLIYFHRPWQEQDWRRGLENSLHLRVEVAQVSAPRPLERVIESVKLATLQAAEPLGEVQGLKIVAPDSLAISSAMVHWDQLAAITHAGQVWIAGESFRLTRWRIARLTLKNSSGATCDLHDLRSESKRGPQGVRQWTIQAKHDGKPVRLLIERHPDGIFHTTIDAQQAALPAWLLAEIPGGNRWESAHFTGAIRLHQHRSQLAGELRGQVDGIDTVQWLGSDLLQTTAKLQLDRLAWRDNRTEAVQGSLEASGGQISHDFLTLLKEKFLCTIALNQTQLSDRTAFQPLDKFRCQFQLTNEGLSIKGQYPWGETENGCVITTAGKPLVSIPGVPTLPIAQLVQLLSPHDPYKIPANREATNMAAKLPLPAAEPTAQK